MTISGQSLAMRLKLRKLMLEHRVEQTHSAIPLTPPTDHPMVLEGYASTIDVDLDRTKLLGWVFGPPWSLAPPLLYKHDPAQPAGKIMDIDYDAEGNLLVRAEVHHPLARRCGAFSVAARVDDYEIKDADSPNFYALITRATLTEISLTDTPSNPNALVMDRNRASPQVHFLELMGERVQRLVQLTQLMKGQANADLR